MCAAPLASPRYAMADQALSGPAIAAQPTNAPRDHRKLTLDLKRQPGFATMALLCLFMLYAPITILVAFSFNTSPSVTRWQSFSFAWFEKVIANEDVHDAAINSLHISIIAALVATA